MKDTDAECHESAEWRSSQRLAEVEVASLVAQRFVGRSPW